MREIKFRVWTTNSPFGGKACYLFNGEPVGLYNTINNSYSEEFLIYQQFTGLKDKNDKEIFEGDILVVPDEYTEPILDYGEGPTYPVNHVAPVVYNESYATFGINAKENNNHIRKGFHSFYGIIVDAGDDFISNECEIIGNIFENPDLLQ